MTLSELLEGLKGVDPETADDIGDIVNVISILSDGSFSSDAYYPDFIIQGCLQRACERRGWPLILSFDCDPDHPQTWVAEICDGKGALLGMAVGHESPSDALLAAYVAAVKEAKEMIPILEFSSAEHRDIRPGYPVPSIFHPGWHCSICGESVPSGHSAHHMHEVDRHIRGTFCATSGANIPDHADEIKFVVDGLIITLKHMKIWSSSNTNGNKMVSSAPIDAQCKRMYYTFEASSIEYDTGE